MVTFLLYFFIFSSWGIGLIAALLALSMKLQEHSARMKARPSFLESVISRNEIPEELKELIRTGPQHPEINEIEEGDDVLGVLFPANKYPPTPEDDDED